MNELIDEPADLASSDFTRLPAELAAEAIAASESTQGRLSLATTGEVR